MKLLRHVRSEAGIDRAQDQGLAADAIVALRRAVALNPTAPAARFWLAQAYRGAGEAARADAELAALRARDPSSAVGPAVR